MRNLSKSARPVLLMVMLSAADGAYAENVDPLPNADEKRMGTTEYDDNVARRFSSDPDDEADDGSGTKFRSPRGPSLDGIRGSAIGPAPGAFGTDAGSPSDLRR